jgi:hypothetical protein
VLLTALARTASEVAEEEVVVVEEEEEVEAISGRVCGDVGRI